MLSLPWHSFSCCDRTHHPSCLHQKPCRSVISNVQRLLREGTNLSPQSSRIIQIPRPIVRSWSGRARRDGALADIPHAEEQAFDFEFSLPSFPCLRRHDGLGDSAHRNGVSRLYKMHIPLQADSVIALIIASKY